MNRLVVAFTHLHGVCRCAEPTSRSHILRCSSVKSGCSGAPPLRSDAARLLPSGSALKPLSCRRTRSSEAGPSVPWGRLADSCPGCRIGRRASPGRRPAAAAPRSSPPGRRGGTRAAGAAGRRPTPRGGSRGAGTVRPPKLRSERGRSPRTETERPPPRPHPAPRPFRQPAGGGGKQRCVCQNN